MRAAAAGLGRQGTNRIEAEAVVKAMADHARAWPDLSLGAVAFSKAQADMLTEVLELHRRRDPVLDAFLREGKSEDVFVKNIENVQGDERDVILISVGYGPQEPGGRLSAMTFGPVNGEGGERRLNVLFSRARVRCEVFASFDPGDIDPSRVSRDGPRVLKRFLDYAKTGVMDVRAPTGLEPTALSRRMWPRSSPRWAFWLTPRSAARVSASTSACATLSARGSIWSPWNATARPITARSGRGNATGCARTSSKTSAGGSTASGAPTGSITASARSNG
jgi:hypothetical protein